MKNFTSIEHQLLLAMPSLNDPNFFRAVIYLCEYNEKGAMGIVINKPMNISLGEILRHLKLEPTDAKTDNYQVLRGGPLAQEQGFIIQRKHMEDQEDNQNRQNEIFLSSSKQDLIALAHGEDLDDTLVSLGYAGWGAGQLEEEIANNSWIIVPMDFSIVFDIPFELRWRRAAATIGLDFDKLSGDVGHA